MSSIQNISLFIPRVFSNIGEERISDKFEEMNIGKVSSVDLVPQYGKDYNAVYVHFEYWNNNEAARNLQDSILDPSKEARVVYDAPWFWIVLENTANKQTKRAHHRKQCIDLTDFAEKEDCVVVEDFVQQDYTEQDFQNMSELEDLMDEEDLYQSHFDVRYVKTIEGENVVMHQDISRLQYELLGLQTHLQHTHQFYVEGIMKNLPIGEAIELRRKMGF